MGLWDGTRTGRVALDLQIVKLHDIIGSFGGCASISLPDCIMKRCGRGRLGSGAGTAWLEVARLSAATTFLVWWPLLADIQRRF